MTFGAPPPLADTGGRLRLVGFFGLVMLVGALGGPLRPLLPVRVEAELGGSPAFSSALQSLMLAGAGVFALFGGALADRMGQRRTLIAGLGHVPLMALVFVVDDPTLLVVAALCSGLASGLFTVGGQSYLVMAAPPAYLGIASALYFLGSTLGASLGSLVAGLVVEGRGFAAVGRPALLASLLLVALAGALLPDVRRAAPSSRPGGRARLAVPGRDVLLVCALRFLPTCFWGTATLLTPLLLFRLSGSVAAVSLYSAVSLACAAACQLLTGRLSDRIGRGPPVLVLGTLLPLAALAMGLSTGDDRMLFVTGVAATAVAWSITVTFPPLVRALAPPTEQGQTFGLLHLLWTSGMLIGTFAGGALVDASPALPFLLFAAANVPTAVVGFLLWRRLRYGPS